jgi:3-hydroxybutyryl-CoA dehydrogenase
MTESTSSTLLDPIIGVVGAGQMGSGIAIAVALTQRTVLLYDASEAMRTRGRTSAEVFLKTSVEKGKLSESAAREALSRIEPVNSLKELITTTFVIEAVTEQFEVKKEIFTSLDSFLTPSSVIASNTSSISLTKLGAVTLRPDRCIGMHFMNPVPVMKLVEIIRGLQTSDATYERVKSLAESMNKTTVSAPDTSGFIVNRILVPMINEAFFLLHNGVSADDIDAAMKLGTNQPMGPLALADFVGLDTLLSILRILHTELGEDKYRPCPLLVRYVEAGWLGKKTQRGVYRYDRD